MIWATSLKATHIALTSPPRFLEPPLLRFLPPPFLEEPPLALARAGCPSPPPAQSEGAVELDSDAASSRNWAMMPCTNVALTPYTFSPVWGGGKRARCSSGVVSSEGVQYYAWQREEGNLVHTAHTSTSENVVQHRCTTTKSRLFLRHSPPRAAAPSGGPRPNAYTRRTSPRDGPHRHRTGRSEPPPTPKPKKSRSMKSGGHKDVHVASTFSPQRQKFCSIKRKKALATADDLIVGDAEV